MPQRNSPQPVCQYSRRLVPEGLPLRVRLEVPGMGHRRVSVPSLPEGAVGGWVYKAWFWG